MSLIAVDMTPVLPGGKNGGAKILAIELLKSFHDMAPHDQFLILTASWNHEDLSILDASNMRRLCVLTGREPEPKPSLAPYPGRLHRAMGKIKNHLKRITGKRSPMGKGLAAQGVDLLFCPFTAPTYAEVNIPMVSVIHDLQHRELPHFFSPHEIDLRDNFMAEVRRKADRIICVSEHTRQTVLKYLKTEPERTYAVHNCIQSRIFHLDEKERLELLKDIGIERRPYMYYPANFWPHKNHSMLLTAYGMFLARHPDSQLDLVFTGALNGREKTFKEAVLQMGLADKVHFLGFVSEKKLAAVWSGCEFLIFPSLYEGFGIPVLEAMSIGKPVLCSNNTSLSEVAGDAALYFDPRKPEELFRRIEEITTDDSVGKMLTARGTLHIRKFRPEDMTRSYLAIFNKAINCADNVMTTEIVGIFSDGWMGSHADIVYTPGPPNRTLELEIEAPSWLPVRRVRLRLHDANGTLQEVGFRPGKKVVIRQPLPEKQGRLTLSARPTFNPTDYDMRDDFRTLSIICRGCWLITPQNERIPLL
ncbi:MAG: glycosyltransferase family 4 protein [Deltaproteobacteria bacterium]|nr:glycosyltransferase family 4 protein [Deltaproteobacteria bacterium]